MQSRRWLAVLVNVHVFLKSVDSSFARLRHPRDASAPPPCRAVHATGWGINLICCSEYAPLTKHCQYSNPRYCGTEYCRCHVTVDAKKLRCVHQKTSALYHWEDHTSAANVPFACSRPNFPNILAEYTLKLESWAIGSTSDEEQIGLLSGLKAYNVTALDASFPYDTHMETNLAINFPMLSYLKLQSTKAGSLMSPKVKGIDSLLLLEVLIIKDVNVSLSAAEVLFASRLQRLEIDNNPSFAQVPHWVSTAIFVEQIEIVSTGIKNIRYINRLQNLRRATLSNNKISYLETMAIDCPLLEELDLRGNQITAVGRITFQRTRALRFLDLSDNPLAVLETHSFEQNINLKWLYLSNTGLRTLNADQLIGLVSLQHLSLASISNVNIEPFALLPLKSLETLDLRHCNLSTVPVAVTQACELKNLWLSFNMLHAHYSLPPEILVQLTTLKQLSFEQNPLVDLPLGLFLLPKDNNDLIRDVLNTLMQLPVWWSESCTPFMWYVHLVERGASGTDSKYYSEMLGQWDGRKLSKKHKVYCLEQYTTSMQQLDLYKELKTNGRCEAARRLRSLQSGKSGNTVTKGGTNKVKTKQKAPNSYQVDSVDRTIFAASLFANAIVMLIVLLVGTLHTCRKYVLKF